MHASVEAGAHPTLTRPGVAILSAFLSIKSTHSTLGRERERGELEAPEVSRRALSPEAKIIHHRDLVPAASYIYNFLVHSTPYTHQHHTHNQNAAEEEAMEATPMIVNGKNHG